eukprot:CAMPEP_0176030718 /NCGR_PEP_ID=MMETSP0120_2-20121206/15123_1 /TAXON_ID=160619 /ORGANISM="Kryptoperidinium foliaceum, Strain CCMP 1326" /LENGTH=80 /DNA_ID=CAMNT_0017363979 /DNA_START=60 /DNA_END=302 /DNA_ORIENTATION=-
MSDSSSSAEPEGSWIPFAILSFVIFFWWAYFSQSQRAVRLRRWYNMKRVQYKKKLGLRDESIYKNGAAGDGANLRHKRQG